MIYNLHLLRAIAASMVVLHHARDELVHAFPGTSHVVMGAAGVDIFFVLSGVVVTLAERERGWGPSAFAMRRAMRVVPMYWLSLMVVGLLLVAGLSPVGVQSADATITNMLRSMFFVPFERVHGSVMPLLGVGWTLNYEAFFYAIVASLAWLASSIRALALIATMLVLVGLGSILNVGGVAWSFYTNPILLEFAAGVALAHLWSRHQGRGRYDAWIGAVLIAAGIALLLWNARYDGFEKLMMNRIIIFGIPAVLCVAGAMMLERAGRVVNTPFVMLMGAASYALYLFHAIVFQCLAVLGRAIGLAGDTATVVILITLIGIVLSHVVGVILHLYVEKPLTGFLSGSKTRARPA